MSTRGPRWRLAAGEPRWVVAGVTLGATGVVVRVGPRPRALVPRVDRVRYRGCVSPGSDRSRARFRRVRCAARADDRQSGPLPRCGLVVTGVTRVPVAQLPGGRTGGSLPRATAHVLGEPGAVATATVASRAAPANRRIRVDAIWSTVSAFLRGVAREPVTRGSRTRPAKPVEAVHRYPADLCPVSRPARVASSRPSVRSA